MRAPLEKFCQSFALSGLLSSATLPLLSYFDGINFSKVVREPFGSEAAIEDLWIPYFCVSTNMSRCQVQVHTQGSLWWHLRASMSVLGYVPPMIDDLTGEVHMDGGYANNLPVDVMSSSAAPPATIIAVDVEDRDISSLQSMHNYGDGISGLTLLINELNPFCTEKGTRLTHFFVIKMT
jgi:lysophospholipid hydrolase